MICPVSCIQMRYGQRFNFPVIDAERCVECGKCLEVCPSEFLLRGIDPGFVDEPAKASHDCYLIHAKDDAVRVDAASGGFITGLILHLMAKGQVDGGIVARCEGRDPLVAESFIATDRDALLSARASKYAPVSNCTVLREVLTRPGRYAFVGTPCMIQAVTRLQDRVPVLKERITLLIGLVCAGMASRVGTKAYIEQEGKVNMADVRRICYRGGGWPGRFRVFGEGGRLLMDRPLLGGSLIHVVPKDHYLRCWNCLDPWAKFADIVVSDPWTEEMIKTERKGRSAIMIRTDRGGQAVASAVDCGDLVADRITVGEMLGYNRHLVIGPDHARHGWMAGCQVVFFGRMKHLMRVLADSIRGRRIGLKTIVRARTKKQYYY